MRKHAARGCHLLVLTALSALTAGCGDLEPFPGPLTEVGENQERWQRLRPQSYQYALERRCFCAPSSLGPVRVTVAGDDVTSRVYADTGDPVPSELADLFPTVDGLFEILLDAIERDAHQIDVTYDPISGVPLDIWIDYDEFVADEELGFRVTETVVLPTGR